MWRRLSIIALALLALGAPLTARPATRPEPAEMRPAQYLPVVLRSPIPVEVVETARGAIDGYPSHYFVYGYVRNLTSAPLYSVTLELEVTMYPYNPDGAQQPYLERVPLSTALPATLPGQINPFSYDLLLGKAYVAQHARQACDQLRLLDAEDRVYGGKGVGGRHGRRSHHAGGVARKSSRGRVSASARNPPFSACHGIGNGGLRASR